ncbi:phage head-tail connector protein [uncultured Cohaesibacter sp.]|uniref:head-tail connector protein n=1 Tax=uncultured Cohaesibacter sp. TaxID=1002546 RepID=UPI00292F7F5B|nr:phage head-tail connector protein [uncultured Cohaesibacter sp.]
MTTTLLTPPALEPVSLAEIKAYLKLDIDKEDDLLRAFLTAARVHLEHLTGHHFITQTWRLLLEGPLGETFRLPLQPVTDIVAAAVVDIEANITSLDVTGLSIFQAQDPAILANIDGFLLASNQRLQLDVETGFGPAAEDVPEPLRLAIKMVVAEWYERRLIADPSQLPTLAKSLQPLIGSYRSLRL